MLRLSVRHIQLKQLKNIFVRTQQLQTVSEWVTTREACKYDGWNEQSVRQTDTSRVVWSDLHEAWMSKAQRVLEASFVRINGYTGVDFAHFKEWAKVIFTRWKSAGWFCEVCQDSSACLLCMNRVEPSWGKQRNLHHLIKANLDGSCMHSLKRFSSQLKYGYVTDCVGAFVTCAILTSLNTWKSYSCR